MNEDELLRMTRTGSLYARLCFRHSPPVALVVARDHEDLLVNLSGLPFKKSLVRVRRRIPLCRRTAPGRAPSGLRPRPTALSTVLQVNVR